MFRTQRVPSSRVSRDANLLHSVICVADANYCSANSNIHGCGVEDRIERVHLMFR